MNKKTVVIISVVAAVIFAAGLGVLIWWLVADHGETISLIELEGDGIGGIPQMAAFTRMSRSGDMFWWFFPTNASSPTSRPIILWLDGVTGIPPSLLANFGMFGPFDFNLNRRENSWIDGYNLLFVDAPLGTGFSTVQNDDDIPRSPDDNAEHLLHTMESFYDRHPEFQTSPLFIIGESHGAQLAVSLAVKMIDTSFQHNLKGIVIGSGIISPALALTKLGFYLEELGYIDDRGRSAIENFSNDVNTLTNNGYFEDAYDMFLTLGDFVNRYAGAIAVNLGHIVEKLTRDSGSDVFGQRKYLQRASKSGTDTFIFMEQTIAPALGIDSDVSYDSSRAAIIDAFRGSFMIPVIDQVEYILENTMLSVTIYNGNLDAVSNTPGQLEWVNNLKWSGHEDFLNSTRQTLAVNGLVQGYFQETARLQFYWINVAGVSVPLDSPDAIRRVLDHIVTAATN